MADAPPSALSTVELSNTTFVFYVNADGYIGYLKGPADSANTKQTTVYSEPQLVKVGSEKVQVFEGFEHLGAIAYNEKQMRVYYVAKNPDNKKQPILKEIWSDDVGTTWKYGALGDDMKYSVMQGSGINAVVLPGTNELRVYFTSDTNRSLAVAWMPAIGDLHAGDWNLAAKLRSVKDSWNV
ncbi:hypothetical protein NA57DRAFT_71875 [Rhizodiscina lignyota]|uniref:Uncharacterized protein n=1 Tax=Rhizodiscina lignyota TaxID=1504668 RepID=A0A9P4IJU4_9PEZI|nr:hypothetical protein NA57DRAFT_71875 [Rhizodiscina lignyota]